MWYVSYNNEEVIDDPENFVIDLAAAAAPPVVRSGIHRCVGDRLAELQLQNPQWEEILERNLAIEVVGAAARAYPNFLRGIKALPARIM